MSFDKENFLRATLVVTVDLANLSAWCEDPALNLAGGRLFAWTTLGSLAEQTFARILIPVQDPRGLRCRLSAY